jgi:hypothetical protein
VAREHLVVERRVVTADDLADAVGPGDLGAGLDADERGDEARSVARRQCP